MEALDFRGGDVEVAEAQGADPGEAEQAGKVVAHQPRRFVIGEVGPGKERVEEVGEALLRLAQPQVLHLERAHAHRGARHLDREVAVDLEPKRGAPLAIADAAGIPVGIEHGGEGIEVVFARLDLVDRELDQSVGRGHLLRDRPHRYLVDDAVRHAPQFVAAEAGGRGLALRGLRRLDAADADAVDGSLGDDAPALGERGEDAVLVEHVVDEARHRQVVDANIRKRRAAEFAHHELAAVGRDLARLEAAIGCLGIIGDGDGAEADLELGRQRLAADGKVAQRRGALAFVIGKLGEARDPVGRGVESRNPVADRRLDRLLGKGGQRRRHGEGADTGGEKSDA